ncbi:MAG: outer-membrane lipoprotein carrier protein LolA [Acidobacteriota bacterium]|nr:outer-membrane lipoprotein carrier protein LolA [Acidobacteriota bacterium]
MCKLLVLLFVAPLCFASQKEDEVLKKMEASGKTLKNLTAELWQQKTNTQIGIQEPAEVGKLYYVPAKNGKFKLRIDITTPPKTIVVDGDHVKFYQPEIRQLLLTSLKRASQNQSVASLAITFGSVDVIRSNYEVRYLRDEVVDGEGTAVLLLVPKTKGPYKQIELWISQKQWLPVRQRFVELNDDVIVIKLSNIKLNTNFDSSKLIDSFNPPNVKIIKG